MPDTDHVVPSESADLDFGDVCPVTEILEGRSFLGLVIEIRDARGAANGRTGLSCYIELGLVRSIY